MHDRAPHPRRRHRSTPPWWVRSRSARPRPARHRRPHGCRARAARVVGLPLAAALCVAAIVLTVAPLVGASW